QDVSAEHQPGFDLSVFQMPDQFGAIDAGPYRDRESKGRGIGARVDLWKNDLVFPSAQPFMQAPEISPPRRDKALDLIGLRQTDRGLKIGSLQVITDIRINIFVIVTAGQLAELPVKALSASIRFAGIAPAVPAPIPDGPGGSLEAEAVYDDAAALAHR